ncbi:MAG: hypothetical protein GY821_16235 [Gammaproteobacteria bacterium]|nr:hypothetical protein [Gammaproteobacteria bacterium]
MQSQYELKNPGNVNRMLKEFYNTTLAGRRSLQNPTDQTLISSDQFFDEFQSFIKGDADSAVVQGGNYNQIIRNPQDAKDIRQLHNIMVEGRENGDTLLQNEFANSHHTPNAREFSRKMMDHAKNEKKKQLMPPEPPPLNDNMIANQGNIYNRSDLKAIKTEFNKMVKEDEFSSFKNRRTITGAKKNLYKATKTGAIIKFSDKTSMEIKGSKLSYKGDIKKLDQKKPKDVAKVRMMARLYAKSRPGNPEDVKIKLAKSPPKWIRKEMIEEFASDPSYNPPQGPNQNIDAINDGNHTPIANATSASFNNNMEPTLMTTPGNMTMDDPDIVYIKMEGQEYNETMDYDENDLNEFEIVSNDPLQSNSLTVNGEHYIDDNEGAYDKTTIQPYQYGDEYDDDDVDNIEIETEGGKFTM